jgi:hypothetical protein
MVALGSADILEVVCSPRLRQDPLNIALLNVASNTIYEFTSLKEQGQLPGISQTRSFKDLFMDELQSQEVEIPGHKQIQVNMAVDTLAKRIAKSTLNRVYLELEKATIGLAAITNRERLIREGKTPIIFHPDSNLTVDYLTLESTPEEVATALARTLTLEGQVLKVGVIYSSIEELSRGLQGKRIKIRDQYMSIR